jgi:S1-C subfamily serine protease
VSAKLDLQSRIILRLIVLVIAPACLLAAAATVSAQSDTAPKPPQVPRPARAGAPVAKPQLPEQVIPIVRRLSGPKVLSLVSSAGARVAAVDDALLRSRDATTSISLGFLLEDGRTIALWLPRNEAELDALYAATPALAFTRSMLSPQDSKWPPVEDVRPSPIPGMDPDLWAIGEGGKRMSARFLGLDGGTGISLISVDRPPSTFQQPTSDPGIAVGDSLRLVAPESMPEPVQPRPAAVRVRFAETNGRIAKILKGSSGRISRIVVDVPGRPDNLVGGVAINEKGLPIGIVQALEGRQAELVPSAVIRRAAARVAISVSTKPRAWLGIRGEDLLTADSSSLESFGWTKESAAALVSQRKGLLLTLVAPGTPAHLATLRAGDVVVKVNGTDVVSTDDFSSLLSTATDDGLSLTLLRPKVQEPLAVTLKPGSVVDPVVATMLAERRAFKGREGVTLLSIGVDALAVPTAEAATSFVSPGLMVLNVAPQSEAYKAGLRTGDMIQQINGRPATEYRQPLNTSEVIVLSILRAGQKMELRVASVSELVP